MRNLTDRKLVASGSIIEIIKYSKYIYYGSKDKKDDAIPDKEEIIRTAIKKQKAEARRIITPKSKMREKSSSRARTRLRRIINSNARNWFDQNNRPFVPKFVTLTFAEEIKDVAEANYLFTKFIKRLNYELLKNNYQKALYSVVIEFQERDVIHYHVLFYTLPYMSSLYDFIAERWNNGHTLTKAVHNVQNLGRYMTKYMTKDIDDPRLLGKKRHFSSRGVKKPIIVRSPRLVRSIEAKIPENLKVFQDKMENDYCGKMLYSQYELGIGKRLKDFGVVLPQEL